MTTPPSIRSLSQQAWLRKRQVQDNLLRLFGSYNYQFLDLPILAPTELFLRKSGGELASQMFSFVDPGSNLVSLRPEFTAPMMLHYLAHAAEVGLPFRCQYAGPVFRYDSANPPSTQFTQVGAELVGPTGVMADAELLSLAAHVPLLLGLNGFQMALADLQVLHDVLDTVGLSDRARTFIIGCVPQLRKENPDWPSLLEQARNLHLTGHDSANEGLSAAIYGLEDDQAKDVLRGFLGWTNADAPPLGQRDPDEVVERLLRKLRGSDDRGKLERGLELVGQLAAVHGEPEAALGSAAEIVRLSGAKPEALERLAVLVEMVHADPGLTNTLVIDFGLARGIAYYNGIIFEMTHPAQEGSLGGGGRYDALARALGSPVNVPAAGFAYNLEALIAVLEKQKGSPYQSAEKDNEGGPLPRSSFTMQDNSLLTWPSSALVLPDSPQSYGWALKAAQQLRHDGLLVELDVGDKSLPEALNYARKNGLTQVLEVDQRGKLTMHQVAGGP
jgi:histidyl-tRNA synthetase